MKRFTSFLISLLLATVAMAQSETTTIEVTPTDGSFKKDGSVVTSGWASTWTSTSEPVVTISVGGVNNMNAATTSGFQMARGANADSDWTFSVADKKVTAYSFKFKSAIENQDVTLSATNANGETVSLTSSYSTEQTFSVDCSTSASATFRISGSNYSIIATDLTLTVREPYALTSLEVGQVYHFENVLYPGYSFNANGSTDVNCVTTDKTDVRQQWYVTAQDGEYYVLRNLASGKFLKGNGQSATWSLSDDYSHDYNKFKLFPSNADYNTLHTNTLGDYAYIHCNGSKDIVGWSNGVTDQGSHWAITKVDYTSTQITELLKKAPTVAEVETYCTALLELFTDAACVTPKLASLAEAKATDAYGDLSTVLQAMVDKVYNEKTESVTLENAWEEANANTEKEGWSGDYAKKFRVQMYEPYSIAGDITSWLGINAHANNDNPTGIYVAEAGIVYVMVEGTIKDGATLRLVRAGSNHRITNATGDGYALTTGLNVVNITEVTDGGDHLYICYNVDTYNPNGADDAERFPHKLSEYDPLKIHIEGGYINGFYNAQGDFRASAEDGSDDLWKVFTGASVDCDDDWEYMEERANLSVIPVLGHRQILLFQLEDVDGNSGMKSLLPETVVLPNSTDKTNPNKPYTKTENWDDLGLGISNDSPADYKVNVMMESWDRIMYSELATMGLLSEADINKMNNLYPRWTSEGDAAEIYDLTNASTLDNKTYLEYCNGVDYSEYFNHHGVGLGTESGYMYGGWDHCGYHINTFGSIVSKLSSEAGPTWGPGHEIGHQHQGIFNLNGQMEVTNNMFANIAVWYMGMGTSRYNGSEGALSSVLNGFNVENNDAYTNNIWALTHMYYRLWLYYHLAGNNTQFMPRLFELCRRDRLENGTAISGDRSLLLFYKHACDAAGEDLTEFFRAHGYLEVMEDRLVGDYTSAIYTQTQKMVDEAVKYVKDKYTKQNLAIIFINDGTSETTLQHNGTDSRALWDGSATAELGSVNDFIDGDVSALNTVATMNSDGTITMSGDGGVGFLILNENGELVSFSNNSTFALSDEAKEAIISGNATFVVVDSESGTTTAEVDLSAMQKTILGELIAKAKPITEKIDDTYTKVGYYKAAAVSELAKVLEYAEEVYAGTSGYEEAYDLLYAEYKKVEANTDAKITLDLNKKYIINNKAYSTRNIAVDGTTVFALENSTGTAAQWSFVESSTAGSYYLKNADGYYCPAVVTGGTGGDATTDQSAAGTYKLIELEHGLWAIQGTTAPMHASASQNYNIVGWTYEATASQWYITITEADEAAASLSELQASIAKTETLLNEVLGTVTYTRGENIALQTTTASDPYYIWSNAPEDSEGSIDYLVDGITGDKTNYFHTEWSSEPTSGSHYIAVDLGDGNTLPRFAFSHTTRVADTDHAKSVDVYGSDDNVTYKYLGSASGMPQTSSTFWQFEGMMISSHRYLRFNVHANRGYWHMAEFDIMPVTDFTPTVNDTYSGSVTVEKVKTAMDALYNGKSVVTSTSPQKTDVDNKLSALETAYEALYTQYKATIDARKATLEQLATNTQDLIDEVGTIEIIATVEAKLQTTNSSGDFYVTTNAQSSEEGQIANLVDGDNNTYFHTDYSGDDSSDGLDHYINIALGSNNATDKFEFSYVTRHNAETNYPTAMEIYGSTDGTTYDKIEEITTGMPTSNSATYGPVVIECTKKFTHLRFMVTANSSNNKKGGHPFFHMAEFDLTTIGSTTININSSYNGLVEENLLLSSYHTTNSSTAMSTNDLVTSVPLLDAQIADQQAAYDKLYAAKNNTAALKANLLELINKTQALYNEMATSEGSVNDYYSTSTLTVDNLSEASTEITKATAVYNNSSATVDEINTAYSELNAKYAKLEDIKALDYTGGRTIGTEITTAETLLAEVMNATETPETVVLQNDDAATPYYIWCNEPANDSHGIAGGLIDKNDDGTANTGTFFGTYWQNGAVDPYTHYLEIDLGCVKSIENFAFDYATRASGYENQRPNGIKVLVSNDKEVYNEVLAVTEGLATGANETWALDEPFGFVGRYVRFAVSSQQGYFNMSDFNIDFDAAYSLQDFYTTSEIDASLLTTLNAAVQQAVKARDCFVTEENYNAALGGLEAAYNSLNDFKAAHVSDRTSLSTLATETNAVVTEVATITEVETAITMQCDDENAAYYLYCNADGTATNDDGDTAGVAALVGENATNTTHLHTTYGNNAQDDDLDHYLRLDMGENKAMMSFKFSYTGRDNNVNNAPTKMLIEGSNDLENFDKIAKLEIEVPESGTATYETEEALGNGKAYRYIRFMVTATKNNATNNGHPFFVLSQFAVTACKTIEVKSDYASPNLPLSTLVTANNEVVDAETMVAETEHYLTGTAYNAAIDELQAAYNALNVAKDLTNIPVILTTDVNNPVLYKIKIKRSDVSVLEFDGAAGAGKTVAVADDEFGNKYQAWYFMQGSVNNDNDDILIMPYWNEGAANTTLKLGSNNITDAAEKVWAVDGSDSNYKTNWYITFNTKEVENSDGSTTTYKTQTDCWNIQPEGKGNYFSNNGGVNNKMGFWSNNQTLSDDGSNFQFILDETDYSKSDAYFALYNLYTSCAGTKVGGTAIGCYTETSVEAYNNAYTTATEKLAATETTDDEYNTARTALEEANNALTRNMPVAGGFYKIRSAYKTDADAEGYCYGGVVYAGDGNDVYWAKEYDEESSRAIWYITPVDGGYQINSLHTGGNFTTLPWGYQAVLSAAPATFTIDVLDDATGILKIVSGQPMHAQASGNKIVGYSGGLNSASAWTIEAVDEKTTVGQSITLNTAAGEEKSYATLYSAYPVTLPDGVDASIITAKADNGLLTMETITSENNRVVPAYTAVILSQDKNDTSSAASVAGEVKYSTDNAVATVAEGDNMLDGTLTTEYIACGVDCADYKVYTLGRKNNKVAMYWAYANYQLSNGTYSKVTNANSNDGGYVKLGANKAYLKIGGEQSAAISMYSFWFGGETTGIDGVDNSENALDGTIYDLQGRKITEVASPGIYIVNGKKVYIGDVE